MKSGFRRRDVRTLQVLLVKELRDLARDRKVLYAAILLPALLFPLLMAFSGELFHQAEQDVANPAVRIGIVAPKGQAPGLNAAVASMRNTTWARGGSRAQVRDSELDAVVLVHRTEGRADRFTILFDTNREASRLARERLEKAFAAALAQQRRNRIRQASPIDAEHLPAQSVEAVDLGSVATGAARQTPQFLPMLLVLILLSASAFAAIDLFPGERERGTLETLLVQPIRPSAVLAAKYIAVFLISVVAVTANLSGTLVSASIGAGSGIELSFEAVLGLFVVAVPLALFVSALLVRVVARSRSVREAQNYLLPLTLLCLMPPFVAGSPNVPFDAFTACLPIAGPALAFREIASGHFALVPLALMTIATVAASALVLTGALKHLSNEEKLLPDTGKRASSARGLMVVLGSILGLYTVGPFCLGPSPILSLVLPLVLFTALPPIVLGRWAGMPIRRLFAVPAPSSRATMTGIFAGIGLALLVTSIANLQENLLPVPKVFQDAVQRIFGDSLPPLPVMLVVMAVLPALFEELLYRRFLLDTMLRRTSATKALVVTAALFAAQHLSIFRVFPTFAAGLVLGWLVLSTHAFWTAPIAHAISNGLVLLCSLETSPLHGTSVADFVTSDALALVRIPIALVLILGPRQLLYRHRRWEPKRHTWCKTTAV